MFVLVIIGYDPDNRLEAAAGAPLASSLILVTAGSHGCSDCLTGKIVQRTTEGMDFVRTNAAELFALMFESQATAQTWTQSYQAALTGKSIFGYTPNYPAQS